MKYILLLCCLITGMSTHAQVAKSALLIAHYGSSDEATREKTLDVITREVKETYPNYEVREAYISPIVRKNLAKKGIHKDSPIDALLKLRADGYDHVYIQSTTLIEGGEMASVRADANSVSPFFKTIKVGNPLLFSISDCKQVVSLLKDVLPAKGHDIVYVGHGNQLPSTATYALLDYMLKADACPQIHVSTIEGYPDFASTLTQLQQTKCKRITLVPLLLVCGNHTKEDIAGVWQTELEKHGYQVAVLMKGLGENEAIRRLYLHHIDEMLQSK